MIPLIVDLETEWRGGQNQALLLLQGLYERGHAAELVTAHGSSLSHRAKKSGIYVHSVPRRMTRLSAASKIRSILAEGRIDIVHANEAHAVTAAWLGLWKHNTPFVISRRVGYPLAKSRIAQSRYKRADCILANSHWVADQAVASGANPKKVCVVYEGVEIPALPPPEARRAARQRWSLTDTDRVLGCVGALQRDKGHEWVIRAVSLLRREFPDCKVLIAGDGEYRRTLEVLVNELGVRENVVFTGFLKDISALYCAIDVFIFPSLFEGLGTSLLSAMAYGIPSITFFGCALGEIIENGKSGIQVEARSSSEIASATAKILRDSEYATRLAQSGRNRIMEKFSMDAMVTNTLGVYEELSGI